MPVKTVVCVAVAVSVASSISITEKADEHRKRTLKFLKKADVTVKWPMETDLPRTALYTNDMENSGCGKDIPGYFRMETLLWESSWPAKAYNTTQCAQRCDEHRGCVGFSSRKPDRGRLQCNLYKGLYQKLDRGMSFVRCVPGFECQKGLPGFKFSHAGTWKDGKHISALDDESVEDCALACHRNRACVGITYFEGHDADKYCFHFENENNMPGPRRDMRASSYSKCTKKAVQVPEDGMRLLQALASKKDEHKDEQKNQLSGAQASAEPTTSEAAPAAPAAEEAKPEEAAPAAPAAEEAKPQATTCSFRGPFTGQYLYDCVSGDECQTHKSQAEAESACIAAGTACGGITSESGGWQLRASPTPTGDSTSETSYVKVCPDHFALAAPAAEAAKSEEEAPAAEAKPAEAAPAAPAAEEAKPEEEEAPAAEAKPASIGGGGGGHDDSEVHDSI